MRNTKTINVSEKKKANCFMDQVLNLFSSVYALARDTTSAYKYKVTRN